MVNEVILIPTLQSKLTKQHALIVLALKRKLERMGEHALKRLDTEGEWMLGEMKLHRPPYRLYVFADTKNRKYYLVMWEHKDVQQKIINELRLKLHQSTQFSVEKLFE